MYVLEVIDIRGPSELTRGQYLELAISYALRVPSKVAFVHNTDNSSDITSSEDKDSTGLVVPFGAKLCH